AHYMEQQVDVMSNTLTEIHGQTPAISRQATAAENGVKETERQTRLDERPWVKAALVGEKPLPSDQPPSLTLNLGQDLQIPMEFTNLGKTAALDISAVVIIEVLPRSEGPHLPKF